MRTILRVLAAIILLGTATWWWQAGCNKGWTKNSVDVWKYDEITEISYPEHVDRFVPGIDFLAAGSLVAIMLAGASLIRFRRGKKSV